MLSTYGTELCWLRCGQLDLDCPKGLADFHPLEVSYLAFAGTVDTTVSSAGQLTQLKLISHFGLEAASFASSNFGRDSTYLCLVGAKAFDPFGPAKSCNPTEVASSWQQICCRSWLHPFPSQGRRFLQLLAFLVPSIVTCSNFRLVSGSACLGPLGFGTVLSFVGSEEHSAGFAPSRISYCWRRHRSWQGWAWLALLLLGIAKSARGVTSLAWDQSCLLHLRCACAHLL